MYVSPEDIPAASPITVQSYEDEEIMGKARATYPFVPRNRVPNGTKPAVNKQATSKKGTK